MLYAILPQPYEIAKEKWGLGKVASAGRKHLSSYELEIC